MTSNRKVINGELLLAKACRRAGVSMAGERWIQYAVDPMHDRPVAAEGYPDQIMNPSTIQIVKKQMTIVTTSGTNTWDCSVISDTPTTVAPVRTTTTTGASIFQSTGQGATPYDRGGIVVRQAATATPLVTNTTTQSLTLDIGYYTGSQTRVVAAGFEVHNVTNELNVSGAVTVWRLPDTAEEDDGVATLVTDNGATACLPSAAKRVNLPTPPSIVAEATNLFGSQTWEAKEGAYIVPVMTREENTPQNRDPALIVDFDGTTLYASQINSVGVLNQKYTDAVVAISPFSMGGAFFTGLHPSSQLVVNAVWIVERFPAFANVDLTTLARPSNPYDPKAIRMYSEITRSMAPGVPVRANGLGDWFSSIARIAASAVPAVLGIVSGTGSLGGILSSGKGPSEMDSMMTLYKPERTNNNAGKMQQSTFGYIADKAYEYGTNWLKERPSPGEKSIVRREVIREVSPEVVRTPGLQQATQIIRQPQVVFVRQNRKNFSNIAPISQVSRNRGTNVWSKEEEYLRTDRRNKNKTRR
jgi:hypothetical protein